jgi:hypothetical protein
MYEKGNLPYVSKEEGDVIRMLLQENKATTYEDWQKALGLADEDEKMETPEPKPITSTPIEEHTEIHFNRCSVGGLPGLYEQRSASIVKRLYKQSR